MAPLGESNMSTTNQDGESQRGQSGAAAGCGSAGDLKPEASHIADSQPPQTLDNQAETWPAAAPEPTLTAARRCTETEPSQTNSAGMPLSMDERRGFAEAAFWRDLQKVREEYLTIVVDKRFVPEGAKLVECYETATEWVVVGDPSDEEDEHGNPIHNCDEMGCCTFSHVVARLQKRRAAATSGAIAHIEPSRSGGGPPIRAPRRSGEEA